MSQLSPETKARLDENASAFIQQLNISLTKDGNLSSHVAKIGEIGNQTFKDLQATMADIEPRFSKAKTPVLRVEILKEGINKFQSHLTGLQEAVYQLKCIETKMKEVLPPPLFPNAAIQIQEFKKFIDITIQHTAMSEKSLAQDITRYQATIGQVVIEAQLKIVEQAYEQAISQVPKTFKETNQVRDAVDKQVKASLEEPLVSKEALDKAFEQITASLDEIDKKRVSLGNTHENSFSKLNEKIQGLRDNIQPNNAPQVKKNL